MVLGTLTILAALAALGVGAGQAGLLTGRAPDDLGVKDGRLKPPAGTPNSVSSQADLYPGHPQQAYARIAPLPMRGDAAASIAAVRAAALALPGATVVEQRDDYLYVQFTTRLMRYVDDAEFWVDPTAGVVQVRSASRLGASDLGANRQRIEAIRAALGGG